jgi:hypothetical protein
MACPKLPLNLNFVLLPACGFSLVLSIKQSDFVLYFFMQLATIRLAYTEQEPAAI